MLRPSFPRLSHPRLAQAIPSIRVHRSRVPGGNPRFSPKISEVKATDQQRPAQAPADAYAKAATFTKPVIISIVDIRRRLRCQQCGRRPERLVVGYDQASVPASSGIESLTASISQKGGGNSCSQTHMLKWRHSPSR